MSAGLPMRHLGLVPDDRSLAAPSWSSAEADERPAVLRVCAGQPLLLDEDDVDLVDLVNSAGDLEALLLDLEADPDEYRLAEVWSTSAPATASSATATATASSR
jgi:hypothetical protein